MCVISGLKQNDLSLKIHNEVTNKRSINSRGMAHYCTLNKTGKNILAWYTVSDSYVSSKQLLLASFVFMFLPPMMFVILTLCVLRYMKYNFRFRQEEDWNTEGLPHVFLAFSLHTDTCLCLEDKDGCLRLPLIFLV